jgi:osmotically-inducible protein OsmY
MQQPLLAEVAPQQANAVVNRVQGTSTHFEDVSGIISDFEARNDSQILNRAKQAIHGCGYEQLRRIRMYCHHGRITLQGRVTTYYLKQVAQEVVRIVPHVRDIDSDLHVICPG